MRTLNALLWVAGAGLLVLGYRLFAKALGEGLQAWLKSALDTKLAEHRHELEKRLEDYKLGPASLLAIFTHRAGALSQVQLEATRQMWARVVDNPQRSTRTNRADSSVHPRE